MTSVYTNKYVSDIPLKRPQETFVDDPSLLDEISIAELEFDLANDIKNINTLHVLHAIAVLNAMIHDLIALHGNRELFEKFRRQQLEKYSIDIDELQLEAGAAATGFHDDDLPLPVESFGTFDDPLPPGSLASSTMSMSPVLKYTRSSDNISTTSSEAKLPVEPEETGLGTTVFISTESLIQTTSLEMIADPITTHSNERLKKEVAYHMAPKIKQQADHLLRCFGLAKAPPLTIEKFLLRIQTYSPSVSVSVWVHSAYMLFKLCVLLDVAPLTLLNVYRFILALIRCLTKKLEDIHQKQRSFATVGGVALKDLCKIEVSFLYLCNFKLVVSEHILNDFLTKDFLSLRLFCREYVHET